MYIIGHRALSPYVALGVYGDSLKARVTVSRPRRGTAGHARSERARGAKPPARAMTSPRYVTGYGKSDTQLSSPGLEARAARK